MHFYAKGFLHRVNLMDHSQSGIFSQRRILLFKFLPRGFFVQLLISLEHNSRGQEIKSQLKDDTNRWSLFSWVWNTWGLILNQTPKIKDCSWPGGTWVSGPHFYKQKFHWNDFFEWGTSFDRSTLWDLQSVNHNAQSGQQVTIMLKVKWCLFLAKKRSSYLFILTANGTSTSIDFPNIHYLKSKESVLITWFN